MLDNFFGLTGPAKMPADVVARLNAATNEVLAQPEIEQAPARARRHDDARARRPQFTRFVRNQVTTRCSRW